MARTRRADLKKERKPRKIFVCSPYNGSPTDGSERDSFLEGLSLLFDAFIHVIFRGRYTSPSTRELNQSHAAGICRRIIYDGDIPFAPHVFFTEFLDEDAPGEREMAIAGGLAFMQDADEVWIFVDGDMSPGMIKEEAHARKIGKPVKYIAWNNVLRNNNLRY